MIIDLGPAHPKNPRIRPLPRPIVIADSVAFASVQIRVQVPTPLREIHPHKRRHAKLRRMQDKRRALKNWSCASYRCPDFTCPSQGSLHIEAGVLRTPLANLTCNCGKTLMWVNASWPTPHDKGLST